MRFPLATTAFNGNMPTMKLKTRIDPINSDISIQGPQQMARMNGYILALGLSPALSLKRLKGCF